MNPRWRTVEMKSEVKFLSGGTPQKSVDAYWGGDIPWVSSGEMTQRRIFDTRLHVTEEGALKGTRIVPENTVLVVVRGMSLAKEFRISLTGRPVAFNQDLKAMEPSSTLDSRFLFYYLLSQQHAIRDSATDASHGTKKLDTRVLESWPLPIPNIAEQRRVSSILSSYDDLIENNRRRIQLLDQATRLLYKEWFVRLRFPGNEHAKIKDGIPKGWEKKPLKNIASANIESYKPRELPEEINYVDISSVEAGRIITKKAIKAVDAPGRARRKVKYGDTIWSNVRPNLRAFALILNPDENDVFSTGFTVISPVQVPFSYLYLLVTTDEFVGYLVNQTTGASYPAVRPDDFERAIVLVPSSHILQSFHERIEPIFQMIFLLEEESRLLANARDLILPRLMNGQIEV